MTASGLDNVAAGPRPLGLQLPAPGPGAHMDRRSMALLEFPLVRARLAAATGFPPGRRLAEALEPSTDRVIVARGLEETSQTRAFVAAHPGAGIGGSKDIGPCAGARCPRRPPGSGASSWTSPPRSRPPPDWPRRCPAIGGRSCMISAARSTRCRACAACSAAASTRPASCSTRRRRAWADSGARSASPTTGCAPAWINWSTPATWRARSRSRS